MHIDKRPSGLDNLITEINGNEILVVDNGTVVGKMAISTIKSIFSKADVNHTHLSSAITDLSTTINSAIASAIPNIDASNIQNSIYVAELQW